MRVSAVRRVFASFLALWFTLVSVDPTWLHACPMHNVVPAGATSMSMHEGGSDAMMHHDHGTMPSDEPDGGSGHTCACLGDCSAGTTTPILRGPPSLPFAHIVATAPIMDAPPLVLLTSRHAFVLPFATAPPAHTA